MLKAEAVQEVRYQYRSDWKLINRELVPVAFDPTKHNFFMYFHNIPRIRLFINQTNKLLKALSLL